MQKQDILSMLHGEIRNMCYDRCSSFRVSSVFYTKRLFQTAHGKMAESRMGEEEACLNQKLEEKI